MEDMEQQAQELLDSMGYDEWTVDSECTLVTPNGHVIEWDGISPDGEVSPLMTLGII
jgi:hypothetical protein